MVGLLLAFNELAFGSELVLVLLIAIIANRLVERGRILFAAHMAVLFLVGRIFVFLPDFITFAAIGRGRIERNLLLATNAKTFLAIGG